MTDPPTRLLRAGGDLLRRLAEPQELRPGGSHAGRHCASGWLSVTVLCEPDDVREDALPGPLAILVDRIEVRVRPAPADKGTELSVRFRDRPPRASLPRRLVGDDPEAELRSALRRSKQLIEVGEVLVVDPAPHGQRPATPTGMVVESWTRAAPGGGVR
ncbi:hypothetical protein [Nocardioides sp. CFH 31398]|uniref:hypothetical protein n=1 Tax=Nocardioides sp. CFH 31398 TaxID=2919579 RepID=UPI001F06C1A7|nr:hypothetical protein [Nocardioides sp. CFH 31398]MCH1866530.1 hypothetical protein [Nocardioides sp. CFH 31398]